MPVPPFPLDPHAQASLDNMTGVDAAIQTLQQSQMQFSLMADAKANIMITVCSLVLTIGFTQLFRESLLMPLIALGVFTFLALVMAILCVLPSSTVSIDGARLARSSNPGSIFFFGNFFRMPAEEFSAEMKRVLYGGSLHDTLIRDVYTQGVVLAQKKYRFLRWSYLLFLGGLVMSATMVVAQAIFWPGRF